jgi:23S rRNA pseudouridine2605 synthase
MNKVHDVPAEESLATAATSPAEEAGTAAEAPRRRRPRKSAEAAADPAAGPGGNAAVPAAEETRRRGRPRKTVGAEQEGLAAPLQPLQGGDGAALPPAPAAPAEVVSRPPPSGHQPPVFEFTLGPPEAGGLEGTEAGSTFDAPRGRGDRNRRRGRRGRAERQDAPGLADAAAEQEGPGEAAPRAPRPVLDAGAVFEEVVSGAFDAAAALPPVPMAESPVAETAPGAMPGGEPPVQLGKRVLRPEPEAPKLHKVLAQSGIGSRRDMEQLIQEGRVTVNGEPAHVGMRVAQGDRIAIGGKPVKVRIAPPAARMLAYHKPVGEVVTFNDPEGRPTVFRNLPRLPQGKWQSVGRLDINTEGLLLFTTSGDLANQLMHPRFGVEREYAVRVLGELDADLRAELLEGVEIDGQRCAFRSVHEGGGEGANRWYRVVITEGRHREVRRMFEEVGLVVNRLIRIRYGVVVLPKGLHRGEWVELDDEDVRAIRRLAHVASQPQGPQGDGQRAGPGKGGRDRPSRGKHRSERPAVAEHGESVPVSAAPGDDFGPEDPLHIPNPLEQTFDRRFATGSKRITAGFGRPSDDHRGPSERKGAKGGPKQPDPMQTSVGYIGADAYFTKPGGGGRRGRGRGR